LQRLWAAPQDVAHDRVHHARASQRQGGWRGQVALEDARECGPVGDIEEAKGTYEPVDVGRVQSFAKNPLLDPASVEAADRVDGGHIKFLNDLGFRQISAVMNVLDHHETHEILMFILVVEGEFHQLSQGVRRSEVVEVERGLDGSDPLVDRLQYGDIKAFLVAEVVVNHPLAGSGARGDLVNPRAG